MGYAATAQTTKRGWTKAYTTNGVAARVDTITDAGNDYLYQPDSLYYSGCDGVWSVYFKFKKITGTPAGYAILQTSPDGYNWSNYYKTSADSFLVTNVDSAVHTWPINGAKITNARLFIDGSGTSTYQISGGFKKN